MIAPQRIIYEHLSTNIASPASTTLSAEIADTTTTTVSLTDGSVFDGYNDPLVFRVDNELLIGTVSGDTLTVLLGSRGALGSTPATHLNGATISLANLYAIAGSAIYSDRLPDGFSNTSPSILFRIRGGPGRDIRVSTALYSVEFFCYGGSILYEDCEVLCRALSDRLHGTVVSTVASGTILAAHEEVGMQNATEPDTEWRRTFSAYRVLLREN